MTDLAYPKDDPSTVDSMIRSLAGVSGDLDGAQQRLLGHGQGLGGVWKDAAGSKAVAELEKLATWVHTGAKAMQQASGALGPYKAKLVSARERIDALRRQQSTAISERNSSIQSTRYGGMPSDVVTKIVDEANASYGSRQRQIDSEYAEIMQEVRTAAATAGGQVGNTTTPFGRVTPGHEGDQVGSTLDASLPSLHDQHMIEAADKAADLAKKAPILSNEELQQLADYQAKMSDPAFATEFMTKLGPDGLLYLTAALTKMGDPRSNDPAQKQRVENLKHIQAMLGTGLGVATDKSNSSHVDDAWVSKLVSAGHEKIDFGSFSFKPYGYQLLGVLMRNGNYSTDFLTKVGGDMYNFEKADPGVWVKNLPSGAMYSEFSLDLNNGGGFDPGTGLMTALSHNPAASKAFFSADDPSSPDGRLNYYLTNRMWGPDGPGGGPVQGDGEKAPGLNALGDALDVATTVDRDATSAKIMEGVVHDLANDPDVKDKKFNELDVVSPSMRDSMGHMVQTYIGDVHNSEGPTGARPNGNWDDPVLPGDNPAAHAFFNRDELNRILADTAKDPEAYKTMYDAEKVYTALAMDGHAKGVGSDGGPIGQNSIGSDVLVQSRQDAIKVDAGRAGQVFGVLDYGRGVDIDTTNTGADADYNGKVDTWGKAGSFVVDKALEKVPIPGVGTAADAYMDALIEGSKHDSSGKTNFDVGQSYGHSRDLVQGLAYNAMYDNNLFTTPERPPAELYANGHPIHYEDMTPAQRESYNKWISGSGQGSLEVVSSADSSFVTGHEAAKNTLAPKH